MSRDGGEDGWTSEYDSTWEEEEEREERARERRTQSRPTFLRRGRSRAARDLQSYRHGYREDHSGNQSGTVEHSKATPNLDFYQNKKCFEPNGLYVEELLNDWKEDYTTLERNHSYIQWLFPLREHGMNSYAKPLSPNEIKMMKEDKAVMTRFLRAYKLMLQFYGIKLTDEETGEVQRADNWEDRFKNLNYHSHNNLRITRILKCLGELGYEHFQAPLVRFFLEETLSKDKLANVKRSVLDYFMFAVKDKHERRKLVHYVWEKYKQNNRQDLFIWGPVEKLKHFHPCKENDVNAGPAGRVDNVGKNPDSKTCKNQERFQRGTKEVRASQHGSKMEKATVSESIPMKDRGALHYDHSNHNTEACPGQSTPVSKDSDSIMGLEENHLEEESGVKKEENDVCEDTKEDSNKERVHKEEVTKKTEHGQEDGMEANGLSNHGDIQNVENKCQGEPHRKRKMPVCSPMTPPADGCAAGDGTQSNHNANPCRAEDEGGQVDRVEDKVKKLKLVERPNMDLLNGIEENDPDDANPRESGHNPSLPNTDSSLKGHCEKLHTDE